MPKVDMAGAATSNPFHYRSKALEEFANGLFKPKKPLTQFATRVDKDKEIFLGGSKE